MGRTHTKWFDVDCSAKDMADQQGCRGQTGKITVMATRGTRSSVILDIDGDGDLDIVTNEFNSEPQVLVSNLAQRHTVHWLGVALVGSTSNRNGLGATVRVTVRVINGGRTLTMWNDGKSGYLSQSIIPLYFGLGEATAVERIDVDWPSGKKQVITAGLRTNTTIKITEPR
jgi:hypothetical protein